MAELERPELLAIARRNVNRLRMDRRLRWRELAGMAGVSEASLYNLNRGKPVSDGQAIALQFAEPVCATLLAGMLKADVVVHLADGRRTFRF